MSNFKEEVEASLHELILAKRIIPLCRFCRSALPEHNPTLAESMCIACNVTLNSDLDVEYIGAPNPEIDRASVN